MSALTIPAAVSPGVAAARMAAFQSSVEIGHRYRMERIEAELKAIRVRRRQNFMRSRYGQVLGYATFMLVGLSAGWAISTYSERSTLPPTHEDGGRPVSAVQGVIKQVEEPKTAAQVKPVVDAVEVAFARGQSQMTKNGHSAIEAFVRVNAQAPSFRVAGLFAQGETPQTAMARALNVQAAIHALGVSVDRIEVASTIASQEDAPVLSGVRLVALGKEPTATGVSIQPGLPLAFGSESQTARSAPDITLTTPTPLRTQAAKEDRQARRSDAPDVEPEGSREIESAVRAAASRRQASLPQPRSEGPGVFVNVPARSTTTSKPTTPQTPPTTVTNAGDPSPTAYTIVSKLEGAVLIKSGSKVRHVRVGEKLPDGRTLGKDLEPIAQ